MTILTTACTLTVQIQELIGHIRTQDQLGQELAIKAQDLAATLQAVQDVYARNDLSIWNQSFDPTTNQIRLRVEDIVKRCTRDLERYKVVLGSIGERRTLLDRILSLWREQIAAPTFTRIERSIESHTRTLRLLLQVLHGYVHNC